jgi:hypothetical protein
MNPNDLRMGIRKSISHLRESYQRADDLVAACERHGTTQYLDLAYTEGTTAEQLAQAIGEVVPRLEQGEQVIRRLEAEGKPTERAEDRWHCLLNCYMELAEASFRPC